MTVDEEAETLLRVVRWCALAPRTVMDVRCGDGARLVALKERLDSVGLDDVLYVGWDRDADLVERAIRLRGSARVRFAAGDVLKSTDHADLVVAMDVLPSLRDDVAWLERMRDHGTWFLFRVPLELTAVDALRPRRLLRVRREDGVRRLYNRSLVLEVLREAGYSVITEAWDRSDGAGRLGRALLRLAPWRLPTLLHGYALVIAAEVPA